MRLLQGRYTNVRRTIQRNARDRDLEGDAMTPVIACLRYLKGMRRYLHEALAAGLPMAIGVIEGACRYVVKDRMEKAGARWSLAGAEGE